MNRSTSYFATASAIRSAPSTCTSSRSKFLGPSASILVFCSCRDVLGGVHPTNEVVYDIRVSDALFQRWCISEIVFLRKVQRESFRSLHPSYHEYNSAQISRNLEVTLGHLLAERHNDRASLSRYSPVSQNIPHALPGMRTKSVDNISSEESSCTKNRHSMS